MAQVMLLNNLAECYWKLERLQEAEQYARQSLALTTDQTGGNFTLYRILRSKGDLPGQIAALKVVLEMSRKGKRGELTAVPQDVIIAVEFVLYSLATLHLEAEDYPGAEAAIRAYQDIVTGKPEAEGILWSALAGQNRWADIIAAADEQTPPLVYRLRELLGLALMKSGEMERAIIHYERWYAEEPELAEVGRRLAGLYAHSGQTGAAEKLLSTLSTGEP